MRQILGRVVLALVAMTAVTEASPLDGLHVEGWYGKLGVESGVVFARERGASPLVGVIATFVHINDDLEWGGLQADALVDWNGDRDAGGRWSVGPEAGVSIYGADVSYFGERVAGDTHHGVQVRAKLTLGVAAVYGRASYALTGTDETSFDVGIQLKAPVWKRRPRRGPAVPVAQR
ncbi:MAG TPA: hypothetical protein VFQ53_22020 [Kofleriaceae bacterium]|nr:hypothetical protein [Kofleriaceae bacterium]